ncbi:MAG: hypothetical protein JWR69_71 [Pedosphaera sp.]|nr:hypothetical protein [Pedosphaera sp.]
MFNPLTVNEQTDKRTEGVWAAGRREKPLKPVGEGVVARRTQGVNESRIPSGAKH